MGIVIRSFACSVKRFSLISYLYDAKNFRCYNDFSMLIKALIAVVALVIVGLVSEFLWRKHILRVRAAVSLSIFFPVYGSVFGRFSCR